MTAQSHLSTYGVTVQQAKDFILANLSAPSTIFNTCKTYGVTNQMITDLFTGEVSISDVRGYFNNQGYVSSLLDAVGSAEGVAPALSTYAPTITPGSTLSMLGKNYSSTASIVNGTRENDNEVLATAYPIVADTDRAVTVFSSVFIDLGAGNDTLTLKGNSSTTGYTNYVAVYDAENIIGSSDLDVVVIGKDANGTSHDTNINISHIKVVSGTNENDTIVYTSKASLEGDNDSVFLYGGNNSVTMADGGMGLYGDVENVTGGSGNDEYYVQLQPSGTSGKLENVSFDGKAGIDKFEYKAKVSDGQVNTGDSVTFTLTNVETFDAGSANDVNIKATVIFTTSVVHDATYTYGKVSGKAGDDITVLLADGGNSISAQNISKIYGGSGNDVIGAMHYYTESSSGTWFYGKDGNDTYTVTGKGDHIVFDTALNATTNVDSIAGFVSGTDKIVLDNIIFTAFTSTGTMSSSAFVSGSYNPTDSSFTGSSEHLYYDSLSGNLYYDADGSGTASDAIKFAILTGHPTISASDFVIA